MKTKTKAYRHGEILFAKIDKLPKGLKETKTNQIMTGSHGNSHTYDNGKIYFTKNEGDEFTFGYFVANDTSLFHPEHSPKIGDAKLPDGVYKLIKQQEHTTEGLFPVIDQYELLKKESKTYRQTLLVGGKTRIYLRQRES